MTRQGIINIKWVGTSNLNNNFLIKIRMLNKNNIINKMFIVCLITIIFFFIS